GADADDARRARCLARKPRLDGMDGGARHARSLAEGEPVSYCTLQELKDRYSERMLVDVSDRGDAPSGEIDTALIDRVIGDADALIDGYLKVRYALPLASVPLLVKDLSLRISIYYAHAHVASEKIKRDYEEALVTLKHISQG